MAVKEIMEGPSYFTLHFVEAAKVKVQKQMDLLVYYWSEEYNEEKSNISCQLLEFLVISSSNYPAPS